MDESDETGVDILLVEDNPGDVRLVEEALDETPATLYTVHNGRDALDFLHQRSEFTDAPHPEIVLLDLNLPKVGGREVLSEIRSAPEFDGLRVIIVTSAQAEHTDLESHVGGDNFITKPSDPDEFMSLVRSSVFD